MSGGRFAFFLTMVLTVWTLMHGYVFWRLSSVPSLAGPMARRTLIVAAVLLWLSYPVARMLGSFRWTTVSIPLEYIGAIWIGTLFLLLSALLAVEVVTLCGALWSQHVPAIRGLATVIAGVLATIAVVQGHRDPVMREHDVMLPGLPAELDGMNVAVISDAHLGTLNGYRWIERLVDRINAHRPDLVLVVGDLVDSNVDHVEELASALRNLRAPRGVWAVTGNHEYYAGIERSVGFLESCGFKVLRNRWEEIVPGLVLAGVDDLPTRVQFGEPVAPLESVLAGMPHSARIYMSHSPVEVETAAAAGVDLMVSGHTHNGQIWPFTHVVALVYPRICGRYEVNGMTLIVGRGTGTWGPPMRLWHRGEWLKIELRTRKVT